MVMAVAVLALGASVVAFGVRFSPVLSGSMRPGIQPGDLVVTVPTDITHIRPGDVIAYYPPGKDVAVIHRLLTVETKADGIWITTQGDANPVPDPWGEVRLQGTTTWRHVATVPLIGLLPMSMEGLRSPMLILAGVLLAVVGLRSVRTPSLVMHPRGAGGQLEPRGGNDWPL